SEVVTLIEQHLREVASMSPVPLEDKLDRNTTETVDIVTLTLKGDMLPWEEIESEYEHNPELYQLLRDIAYDKQLVVTIGKVHEFFVLSIGASTDYFTK